MQMGIINVILFPIVLSQQHMRMWVHRAIRMLLSCSKNGYCLCIYHILSNGVLDVRVQSALGEGTSVSNCPPRAEAAHNVLASVYEAHSAGVRLGPGKLPHELAVDVSALGLLAVVAHEHHHCISCRLPDGGHPCSHVAQRQRQEVLVDLQQDMQVPRFTVISAVLLLDCVSHLNCTDAMQFGYLCMVCPYAEMLSLASRASVLHELSLSDRQQVVCLTCPIPAAKSCRD